MIYGAAWAVLALVCMRAAIQVQTIWIKIPVVWCAISFTLAAFAYFIRCPGVFLKLPSGQHDRIAWLLHGPYFAVNRLLLAIIGFVSREPASHEIVPGLHQGRRPAGIDSFAACPIRPVAVVDLTCEFSEAGSICDNMSYLCLPVLDGTAPSLDQLHAGVDWITGHIRIGPVYVHCAKGHERSAAMIVAYLLSTGAVRSPQEGLALVRAKRPGAGLTRSQARMLRRYAGERRKRMERVEG